MWLLAIAIIVVLIFKSPVVIGWIGELRIKLLIGNYVKKNNYLLFNDLYIMDKEKNATVQIDHILITNKAIYVIETKNYKGWIFGDEKSYKWTQVIYKEKNQFYNPIKQNEGHIKALKNELGLYRDIPFINIVAFSYRSTLKNIEVNSQNTHVIYETHLKRTIKRIEDRIVSNITEKELDYIKGIINNKNISKQKGVRKEHVNNIKNSLNKNKVRSKI